MTALRGMLIGVLELTDCAATTTTRWRLAELRKVKHVDLARYVGSWYDIASFPQSFQRNCTGTTALYTIRSDGEVDVLNCCHKGSLTGKIGSALGRARIVDRTTNAKLEVSFFRPFWGDYWIIDLGPNYEYAVVGHPSRDYLWILSRTPTMDSSIYEGIIERLKDQYYDVARLSRTLQ